MDLDGRFNDGRSAASRSVTARLSVAGVEIRDGDGLLVALWRREDISPPEPAGPGRVRLSCRADGDARLTLPDHPALKALGGAVCSRPAGLPGWVKGAALAAAVAAAALVAVLVALPAGSRLLAAAIPLESERRLGTALAEQLHRQWRRCDGPGGEAALGLLMARLAASLPPERRPRRVVVVDRGEVNAIALPGGEIIVFKGLLARAEGPDEVAGVLAHETTHVAARHPLGAVVRGLGAGMVVTMITGDTSGVAATAVTVMMVGAYSREDEAAADAGAVRLLRAAGIGTDGLSAFFRRIAGDADILPAWLSTHPESLSRAAAVDAAGAPGRAPALDAGQWAALRGMCG
ncbi:MAG: M48 family metallopeptidase [Magnetospirillum sp.]|nr:M48 family metallopeptidase [Magnetospirillum sp.]